MDKETEKSDFLRTYIRRPGTDDSGRDYETKVTALLALRCAIMEDTDDMWLGSNMEDVGDFDDIVLYRRTSKDKPIIYLVQLKHQENLKNIHRYEFTYDKSKSAKRRKNNENFSLSKYNKSFIDLKEKLDNPVEKESEILQHLREVQIVFVLFTNKKVPKPNDCDFLSNVDDASLNFLDTSSSEQNIYKFDDSNLKEYEKGFLQGLFLFAAQAHVKDVDGLIEETIREVLEIPDKSIINFTKVVNKFVEFIRAWIRGTGIDNPKKSTLTKSDILNKLTDLLLGPYKYSFAKESFNFYDSNKKTIWNKIIRDKSVTIVDEDDSVHCFLKEYVGDEVKQYLIKPAENWGKKLNGKTLDLLRKKHNDFKDNLLKMIDYRENISTIDLYSGLWLTKKISLLLKISRIQDYQDIFKILKLSNYSLRVIILKDQAMQLKYENQITNHFVTLEDLNQVDRSFILNQLVKLQNRLDCTLGNLVDESMYKLITCKDVIHILQENFNVGNKYEPLMDLYIERSLSRVITSATDQKEKKYDLQSTSTRTFKLDEDNSKKNVVIMGDFEDPEKSKKLKPDQNVHQQVKMLIHRNLEWKKAIINIQNRVFLKEEEVTWVHFDDDKNYFLNGTHIISDDPGMGKSTYIDFLTVRTPSDIWIIKIILNKYEYEEYYDNNQNNSVLEHLNFFNAQLLDNCNNLRVSEAIFQKFLDVKKVLVILDGFDEIFRYKKNVTSIAKCIHDAGFPLWLTTRPHMKRELEETFRITALKLHPFTISNQETYLTKYFSQIPRPANLNEGKYQLIVKHFVETLLAAARKNLNDWKGRFMEIPLQTKLLAEIFKADCKKSLQTGNVILDETFNMLDLYEKFIKIKIDVLCGKFGRDAKNRKEIEKQQKVFAVKYLYPNSDINYLYPKMDLLKQLDDSDSENEYEYFLQRDGIVMVEEKDNGVKVDHRISFIHRTFAEFLAAQWLSENFRNADLNLNDFLRKLTFGSEDVVFYMFNLILAKGCPLHWAILNGKTNEAKGMVESDPTSVEKLDKGGRTILHSIAITYRNSEEIKPIVEVMQNIRNKKIVIEDTKDFVCDFTALDYATFKNSLKIANEICEMSPKLTITNFRCSINTFLDQCKSSLRVKCSLFKAALRYYATRDVLMNLENKNTRIDTYCARFTEFSVSRYFYHYITEFNVRTISELFQYKSRNVGVESSNDHYYLDFNIACALGTEENVNDLLSKGAQINTLSYGVTPLHSAARHNKLQIVKLLLNNGGRIDICDCDENIALHGSASSDIARELLVKGAHINKQNFNGDTPLNTAGINGHFDVAKLLLTEGADVNITNKSGDTSLHCMAKCTCNNLLSEQISEALDTVKLLLSKGADINKQNKSGQTPLNTALKCKNLDIAKLLLSKDADCSIRNNSGLSSIHYAAWRGYNEILSDLISKGECLNMQNIEGEVPLHFAVASTLLDTVELLLTKGANINKQNIHGYTPLNYALSSGNLHLAKLLLSKEADCNIRDNNGNSLLHDATRNEIIELMSKSECVNTQGRDNEAHLQAVRALTGIVELLLIKGADINKQNKSGETPLNYALNGGNLDIAKLLLSKDADCNIRDNDGNLPLHNASRNGHNEIISELISKGQCINIQNVHGEAPLHLAVASALTDTVELLLSKGADINIQTGRGRAPLHVAIIKTYPHLQPLSKNKSMVRLLLEEQRGANVNIQDNEGDTPLHCVNKNYDADLHPFSEEVTLLLQRGADPNIRNKIGNIASGGPYSYLCTTEGRID